MIPNHVVKCTNIMKSLNLSELQNIGVALGVAASSKIALIGQLHPQFALQFSGCVVHRLHKVEERLPLALVELGSIKTGAHRLVKVGHRAQQLGLGFWRHVRLQTVVGPACARPSSAAKLVTQTVVKSHKDDSCRGLSWLSLVFEDQSAKPEERHAADPGGLHCGCQRRTELRFAIEGNEDEDQIQKQADRAACEEGRPEQASHDFLRRGAMKTAAEAVRRNGTAVFNEATIWRALQPRNHDGGVGDDTGPDRTPEPGAVVRSPSTANA